MQQQQQQHCCPETWLPMTNGAQMQSSEWCPATFLVPAVLQAAQTFSKSSTNEACGGQGYRLLLEDTGAPQLLGAQVQVGGQGPGSQH